MQSCTPLPTLVNDVFEVRMADRRLALKLYHPGRDPADVRWEVDLVRHLADAGVSVAEPVRAGADWLIPVTHEGAARVAVLWEWVAGAKPTASPDTYVLLGELAGRIHRASDSFVSAWPRETYDAETLVEDQLRRMRPVLLAADRWPAAVDLGSRLAQRIADPSLDRGVCHVDLTLDNVHRSGETLTAFDFDSAGSTWRALEPYGVLLTADRYFQAWLSGYRAVRPFSAADEAAVTAFAIIGELRNVAWKLGFAESSRGDPLLTTADLPSVVDGWLEWEATRLS